MRNTFLFREAGRGWLIPLITGASFTFAAGNQFVLAQATTEQPIVVTAQEEGTKCLRRATGIFAQPFFQRSKRLRVAAMGVFLRRTL